MMKYNVIWFDDECNTLSLIKESALLDDITLNGYENAEEGIKELERNILSYDAAVVDGIFFRKQGQSGDAKNQNALSDVARAIDRLMDKKKLPWFILSGQKSFTKGKNSLADAFKDNKVYDKLSDKDLNDLWNDIKSEADQQPETQIRHKYQRVFEVCSDKYIGVHGSNHLLAILKCENSGNAFLNPELYFNPLRKIMEDLFKAFNMYGFMPDVFVKPTVSLNESSKFLSGSIEKGYQLSEPVFPKVVSDIVRNILSVCQPAAHRTEIDNFVSQVNSPYLLLSLTYQLLDVLLWARSYIDQNSDVSSNILKFNTVQTGIEQKVIISIIEKDEKGNFHCGEILLTYKMINENRYSEGDKIRIIKTANNTNDKTMQIYPQSALQTEKLSYGF